VNILEHAEKYAIDTKTAANTIYFIAAFILLQHIRTSAIKFNKCHMMHLLQLLFYFACADGFIVTLCQA